MATLKYFQYQADEFAAELTGQTHRAFAYAARKGLITQEQYDELVSTTVVTPIANGYKSFGKKLLARFFGKDSSEDSWQFPITTIEKD